MLARQRLLPLVILTVVSLLLPSDALAWGRDGHVIVAKIAELNLSPAAAQAVYDLLAGQSIATDKNANWADDIKPGHPLARFVGDRYPNNGKWHFVDIAVDAESYDAARDCDNGDCIIDQLGRFRETMADASASDRDRREALLFVIHFCGDIHQPLHCAERNGGSYETHHDSHLNLHSAWDDNLVYENENLRHLAPEDAAQRLNSLITSEQKTEWANGGPQEWAWESHRIAVTRAYRDADGAPLADDNIDLDEEYVQSRKIIVQEQPGRKPCTSS